MDKVKQAGTSSKVMKLVTKFLKTLDDYELTIKDESDHWVKDEDENVIWATAEVTITYDTGRVVLYDW